jgi:hypothetical protein
MKLRNPFYLAFALGLATFVAAANHKGWSLLQSVAAGSWRPNAVSTQHK